MTLPHSLNRSIFINAAPETVFAFFEDSAKWAAWWGAGSTIDPRPGGKVYVRYPNAVEASGEIVDIAAPERLVFTYGYAAPGAAVPPGGSRVTIALAPEGAGTRLTLTHELPTTAVRDEHVQGWRYQLSVFANAVSNAMTSTSRLNDMADTWFRAWAEPTAETRAQLLASVAHANARFGDKFSVLDGLDDVSVHAAAAQKFMPGVALTRAGDARHCLGVVLVDWTVPRPDGTVMASGTNVFRLGADGRFLDVVGVWN